MKNLNLGLIKSFRFKRQLRKYYEPAKVTAKKGISLILIASLCFPGCKKDLNNQGQEQNRFNITKSGAAVSLAAATTVADFTIAVLPDTQNYMSGYFGGLEAMFTSQINWIINNQVAKNIVYVVGLGDISEHGDSTPAEWVKAKTGYYSLETSAIPYGLAVGNHDQTPFQDHILSETTNQYNQYFGVSHFTGRTYYGGHYSSNNNSHYDLFSAGGKDFIVIYIEYDHYNDENVNMNTWAYNLLQTYASRKAIVVTHYMIGIGDKTLSATDTAAWGVQGRSIYTRLKACPNVFMFLGGHVYGTDNSGEGYREDTYNGNTIRTYLSDYQQRQVSGVDHGGNGMLRLMTFSVDNDDVTVKTYSPYVNQYETDPNSEFTKPLFGAAPVAPLANGKYKIIARHSGKALVVYNASTANGASIVQWDYTSTPATNDEWNLTKIGTSGYYRITNVNSNLDMNVQGISTAVGGVIVQYPYNSAVPTNDEFGLIDVGGGYYKIIARHSGLCFNVAGGNNVNGALLKQWTYQGTLNEQFQLVAIP